MMIYPPIDKLIKMVGNRYKLVCLVSKRAKEIKKDQVEDFQDSDIKEVSIAAKEVYVGDIKAE